MLKIGHRGAKAHIAENTLASIEKALSFNVDGIEIDVHRCASGELVVFHDFTLDRMTNGSGEVSKFTLQDLKALHIQERYTIPTLKEVLDLVDKRCVLNIELKGKDTAEAAIEIIQDYISNHGWASDQFLISSFQHHELEKVFKAHQDLHLAVLTKASVSEALEFAKTIKAYAIHPNVALLTKNNVKMAQKMGFKVIVWTVNDAQAISRMKRYGVDGIISDNPELL